MSKNKNEEIESKEAQLWATLFFAERCRVLEFYVTTLVVMFGAMWFLGKKKLCDEPSEVLFILLIIFVVHGIFFLLFTMIDKRLQNQKDENKYDVPHTGEARFGQKSISSLGKYIIWGGCAALIVFVLYLYSSCNSQCDECKQGKSKSSKEVSTEIKILL